MNQYDEDSDSSTSYRLPGLTHPEPFDYMAEGGGEREPPPPPETVGHSGLDSDPDSSDPGEGGEEEPPSREDPLDGWDDPTSWPGDPEPEPIRIPGLSFTGPSERASEADEEAPAASKAQAPDRPPKARRRREKAAQEPGPREAGRSGAEKPTSEERRGAGEKPGRAGGQGGYPENGKTTQGQGEDTRQGRPTRPGTRNREAEPPAATGRKVYTHSSKGETENPVAEPERADLEALEEEPGSVHHTESAPSEALQTEEELLDFLRRRPSKAPYLQVPEELREALTTWRPILEAIPGFMAMVQLILFSTRHDEHGVVCDYRTVFRTFGLSESYAYDTLEVNSGDLLELYRTDCDPEMHYRKYSERDGLARKIDRTGLPEKILRMARRLKVAPDTFSGDWVYLINGESANRRNRQATIHEDRMTEADNYEPTIPAPESAQVIQKYLNHMLDPQLFSHGGYGVMAKLDDAIERVHELEGEPPFDSEEKVDTALRTLYWMRQYPTPVYVPCDGSPRLKADHFNQAMNLSSEIRPALYTRRPVELDGAKMHMASLPVIARREGLSAPTVERYLKASLDGKDLWTELASHFDAEKMPDAKARRKAAKISYSAVYGAGENFMLKSIVDRYGGLTGRWVGFDAVEGILDHELIAEVFEVREQLFDRIREQGFLEDAYGRKIRPEDFPHKAEDRRVRSVLAYVAASYEQMLVAELFKEAAEEMEWAAEKESRQPRFRIWLYQADGVTVRVSSKQKPDTIINRLQERFDRKAAELGLITRLEVDWRYDD